MENTHNRAGISPSSTGRQFGNYQLLHMLSQSDVADVYLAKHVRMQVPVAIKCLYGRFIGEVAEEFQRQYATLASFRHPHILSILFIEPTVRATGSTHQGLQSTDAADG